MTSDTSDEFRFRRSDDIGAAAAEDDLEYLAECFIDTGDLGVLADCANSKRVVLGRTGAGKSALLTTLANKRDNVVQLSPHSLSLNYIANNQIIQFFEQAGVNLIPFYMLLWKHIFVVELLRAKFDIKTEEGHNTTMRRLRELLYRKDHIKEQAVDYLEKWGNRFWLTADARMRELTERIERNLSGSLEGSALGGSVRAGGAINLTSEERSEVVERGRRAVSEVQIRELENIIQVLADDVFSDTQEHYYLTIDTLDEEWTDDRIKYRLIKALLDTIRTFRRVKNVKIVAAMRQDLLHKVLHSTSDPGFQEEKYESLYLFVRWTRESLIALLTARLNRLIRRRYTKRPIEISEILPTSVDRKQPLDYILERTFYRPRDAILFLNECIATADGRPRLSASVIKQAEVEYSHKRLQSLATEWRIIYPNLKATAQVFFGMPSRFELSEVTREFLDERYQDVVSHIDDSSCDPNTRLLETLYGPSANFSSVRNSLVRNLYLVGLLGIKTGPNSPVRWAYDSRPSVAPGEVRPSASIYIHPMFFRALETRVKSSSGGDGSNGGS